MPLALVAKLEVILTSDGGKHVLIKAHFEQVAAHLEWLQQRTLSESDGELHRSDDCPPKVRDRIALTELLLPQQHREAGIDHAYQHADRLLDGLSKQLRWIIVIARFGFVLRISVGLWLNLIGEAVGKLWKA